MRKIAPWAPKAGNVALAQAILGVFGSPKRENGENDQI